MWQKVTQRYTQSGELVVLGIVQEQHPDRARLYRQWRQIDWPVAADALNQLGLTHVPIPVAIDESGIVRHERILPDDFAEAFMDKEYDPLAIPAEHNRAQRPDPDELRKQAEQKTRSDEWTTLGDAYFLFHDAKHLSEAIEAYEKALELQPREGATLFRLGVALRRRSESEHRQPGDAQRAIENWGRALATHPNQYIWRRRIQQYGPRLDKPYNFYSWIKQAREEIRARGETPPPLSVEPRGSEIASPTRNQQISESTTMPRPDTQGRIARDKKSLVVAESVVTPSRVKPGRRVRVRVTFRLAGRSAALWNNESAPLTLSVDRPPGLSLKEGKWTCPNPTEPESREPRVLEFEMEIQDDHAPGEVTVPAYALYNICEKAGGVCRYLRKDLKIAFQVDPDAQEIQ